VITPRTSAAAIDKRGDDQLDLGGREVSKQRCHLIDVTIFLELDVESDSATSPAKHLGEERRAKAGALFELVE
jgi:hypothetical protein